MISEMCVKYGSSGVKGQRPLRFLGDPKGAILTLRMALFEIAVTDGSTGGHYGLVSLMELAAHRGDLHRHHLLRRHLCRVLYCQAPAAHQGRSGCGAHAAARAAADGRWLSAAARAGTQARHRRMGARDLRRQAGHDLVVCHLRHHGRHLPADVPHGARSL